jgi:VWFA-related protein
MKRLAAIATALASLTLAASAQTPPAAPGAQEPIDSHTTIRSETRLVLVDSVVTDKKGVYIHGLAQKDFKVYEDNKEQPITSFSFESSASPDPNRKHYMVLFFDNSTVGPGQQTYARDAATKFIDKNAGPNRLMAIVEFGGALKLTQNFTDDADRLKKVVAGVKFSSVGAASNPPGLPPIRGFSNFSTRGVLGALRDMAKGLADVPGRKQLERLTPREVEIHHVVVVEPEAESAPDEEKVVSQENNCGEGDEQAAELSVRHAARSPDRRRLRRRS